MSTDNKKQYLEHILSNLPHKPGIYKMLDEEGKIIYVGKAKDLKNRVSSYFQTSKDKTTKTIKMVEQICDINYTEVESELEAIILETNFIKELRPKYNILMKDDKSYVYIKITINEEYPRIFLVRKPIKDKAKYFGPKTAVHKVVKTLKVLKKIFPFRNCELAIDYNVRNDEKGLKIMSESQIEYHKNHCIGPCVMSVKPEEYKQVIQKVINFLEGKHEEIIDQVKQDMVKAAQGKKFEIAAQIRDKLKAVEEIIEPQRISDPTLTNLDVINYYAVEEKLYFNLFQIRNGKLIDQANFTLKSPNTENTNENQEALQAFLEQYYEEVIDIPKEILIPHHTENDENITEWLSHKTDHKVNLTVPERGKKNHLLELTLQNAKSFARQSQIKWEGYEKPNREEALKNLQALLNLEAIPKRIECYDISHFAGTETVASMVVFENGFPKKTDYRHFKMHQNISGEPNDFASMEEVIFRRIKYLKPAVVNKSLVIKKANKKELKEINKTTGSKYKIDPVYFKIFLYKEEIGLAQVIIFENKKCLINKFEIKRENFIQDIIRKIAEKLKVGKIYIRTNQQNLALLEEANCTLIKKIPEDFVQANEYVSFEKVKNIEDLSFKKKPDLIVIDGGKGQLSSAIKSLNKHDLKLNIISIAKQNEELFLPEKSESIKLENSDPIILMIRHLRDEAHRFAITFNKKLRLKVYRQSILDEIPGLGEETKIKLLKSFGSIDGIKGANQDQIIDLVGEKLAEKIKTKLSPGT